MNKRQNIIEFAVKAGGWVRTCKGPLAAHRPRGERQLTVTRGFDMCDQTESAPKKGNSCGAQGDRRGGGSFAWAAPSTVQGCESSASAPLRV